MDHQLKAKMAVVEHFNDPAKNDAGEINVDGVLTVWFCYILGGWKTWQIVNSVPDVMYEVTYNAAKGEMYLDMYQKMDNVCTPDDSEAALEHLREKLSGRAR